MAKSTMHFDEDYRAVTRCCKAPILARFEASVTVAVTMVSEPLDGWPPGTQYRRSDSTVESMNGLKYLCSACGNEVEYDPDANSFYEEYGI